MTFMNAQHVNEMTHFDGKCQFERIFKECGFIAIVSKLTLQVKVQLKLRIELHWLTESLGLGLVIMRPEFQWLLDTLFQDKMHCPFTRTSIYLLP